MHKGKTERQREMRMGMKAVVAVVALLGWLGAMVNGEDGVTYDGRSLIINGTRRILFSGSIHYPRSTPEMWPYLISRAKRGGLDVIQTYVFWNVHEPIQGQYNFQGRYNLVRFIKEVKNQGLYVSLRVGPFIQSEWKYGGLPFWLHDVPGIVFRSDNEPYKHHMQSFVSMIVNMMKSERLYASQGGPIILSQIENEYQMVEGAFHERGPPYVQWAASMAVGLNTGVPWMMCKQDDAPDPVINSCNGMRCGTTFVGPNSPSKPSLWTENWISQYQVFGEEPYTRTAEDIAFHVALFIARNGSFVNYYMYHGGTNLGNSASSYVTTSYYDEAPLDEYGLIREPKWGHLRELHAAVKQSSEALLWGTRSNFSLGHFQQAYVFEANSGSCSAFLVNSDSRHNVSTVRFRNLIFKLPRRSISILPDCKNISFNTATVNAQSGVRTSTAVEELDKIERWEAFADGVSNIAKASFTNNSILEQLSVTKDATDYLWYTTSYEHQASDDQLVLKAESHAHVLHAFVNDVLIGSVHGGHKVPIPAFERPITLINGKNNISLLSVMVGSPDGGAYLERRYTGLHRSMIQGENKATDLSNQLWGYEVGLQGEKLQIYTETGSKNVTWKTNDTFTRQPLIWYKTKFDAPLGIDPVVLNLKSMAKGQVWINGESIGRYWVSFLTPKNQSSQTLYHIPREFLKPSGNLLVLFEEIGGDPLRITVETISVSRTCSAVPDDGIPSALSHRKSPVVRLQCYRGKRISAIEFASYGNPDGDCESFSLGICHSNASKVVVEEACLGRRACSIPVKAAKFGGDPCPGTSKSLLVVASCS